jgi:hypothetical protein
MASDLPEALVRLVPRWRAQGVGLLPPATPRDVRAVFGRLGAVATPDVVALYGTFGGMREMDDDNFLRIWSLEEIAAQERSVRGVLFADYMISCWEYRLSPASEDHSAVRIDGNDDGVMAIGPTLEAFLISLDHDVDFLHGHWWPTTA